MRILKISTAFLFVTLLGIVISQAWVSREYRYAKGESHRSFYFWKTRWVSSAATEKFLRENSINRIYFRFFDVDLEPGKPGPHPVAPLEFVNKVPKEVDVVPVIYLKNRIFLSGKSSGTDELAKNVIMKVSKMARGNDISFREIQIDCDWTLNTKKSYFSFLEQLKKNSSWAVSATIRLHQIKYLQQTGVPPVDRGMLMFYNMGTIESNPSRISIFNPEDANKYASFIKDYPLQLDVALPVFSWAIHTRGDQVIGLIEKANTQDFESSGFFSKKDSVLYQAARAGYLRGWYFRIGDQVKFENITPALTEAAAKMVAKNSNPDRHFGAVALFDLDERNLRGYTENDFKKVFSLFE